MFVGYNQINEMNESKKRMPSQGQGGKGGGWVGQGWVSVAGMPRQEVQEKERRKAGYSKWEQTHLISPLPVTGLLHVAGSMSHE